MRFFFIVVLAVDSFTVFRWISVVYLMPSSEMTIYQQTIIFLSDFLCFDNLCEYLLMIWCPNTIATKTHVRISHQSLESLLSWGLKRKITFKSWQLAACQKTNFSMQTCSSYSCPNIETCGLQVMYWRAGGATFPRWVIPIMRILLHS